MRVLLDTNVLISYLLSSPHGGGSVATVVEAVLTGRITLLLPRELVDELFGKVLSKPHLAARIPPQRARSVIATLQELSEFLPPVGEVPIVSHDPKDDYLLAYARLAAADFLVMGDDDLLALGDSVAPLRIVSPAAFAALLGEDQAPERTGETS